MEKRKKFNFRTVPLYVIFAGACLFFIIKLVNIQITGTDRYVKTMSLTQEREVVVQSLRGEIYDRNGVCLVKNEYSESLMLDYGALPKNASEKNDALAQLIKVLRDNGYGINDVIPVTGTYPHVEYDAEALGNSITRNRFDRFLLYHNIRSDVGCLELYEQLFEDFELLNGAGEHIYDPDTEDAIIRLRYSLDATDFAADNPYLILPDADLTIETAVLESGCKGVIIKKETERIICVPGVGSNVIGRTGKIPADRVAEFLAKGYPYDAVVGLSGAEAAFEDILKGENGITVYVEDSYGNVIDSYVKKEPVPGKNIYLTIDIELQAEAERLLGDQIKNVARIGRASGIPDNGEKADSGALTVMSAKTGQVLALASYPTYDLSTFSEDYPELAADPAKPLFDRCLSGTYQPGSTFKLATTVAALMSKKITTETEIYDSWKYTFYKDYQPTCWRSGGHGLLGLIDAIGVSCNYYFYEVGRLTGIETMNRYCKMLGLGDYTGIELPENKGILASPEYKESINKVWVPGDTLQAAIGQSDNSFNPLQLSSYIATIVNGGTRYKATILYKVCNYSGSEEEINEPQIIDVAEIDENAIDAVKRGMRRSKELTSTTKFYKFPVGTKTGTAQTSQTNNNAVLVAFAPYNDPEITLSCVIENGASGVNAAAPVLKTISYYYGLDPSGNPLPETEE